MPTQPPVKRWQTILALIFSALGFVYFLVQTLFVSGLWLVSLIDPQTGLAEVVPNGLLVWASFLSALLLIPSFWISLNELRNKPVPSWLDGQRRWLKWVLYAAILVWPLMIGLGWLVSGRPGLAVYILGPINILVAGVPVVWVYALAQRKLNAGSVGRKWRIFGFSLTIGPVMIIAVELIVMAILGVLVLVLVTGLAIVNPAFNQELETLSQQLSSLQDGGLAIEVLEPYLMRPVMIFGLLAVMSGFIPLIEELLKPIALWSMAGRDLTDQEGFVAGLLSGAGFALMENLLYFTNVASAEDWLFMVIGRAGTGVLHMFGSGLVGLALVRAWRSGKWPFLGAMTALAVVVHGLWNALALLGGLGPSIVIAGIPSQIQEVLFYLPLSLLLILEIGALLLINRRLRKDQKLSESPDLLASDEQNTPISLTTEE